MRSKRITLIPAILMLCLTVQGCYAIAQIPVAKEVREAKAKEFPKPTREEKAAFKAECDSLAALGKIKRGFTYAQLKKAWGKPDFQRGSLVKWGWFDQWTYLNKNRFVYIYKGKVVKVRKVNGKY